MFFRGRDLLMLIILTSVKVHNLSFRKYYFHKLTSYKTFSKVREKKSKISQVTKISKHFWKVLKVFHKKIRGSHTYKTSDNSAHIIHNQLTNQLTDTQGCGKQGTLYLKYWLIGETHYIVEWHRKLRAACKLYKP